MELIERIFANGQALAYIIRAEIDTEKTTFLTPPDFNLQMGFVVYPAGGVITRHVHLPVERHLVGTSEVLLIKNGCCEVDIYDAQREMVATRVLREGDILLMISGGHGFRMLEDSVLLEIKQGPYMGLDDKERF